MYVHSVANSETSDSLSNLLHHACSVRAKDSGVMCNSESIIMDLPIDGVERSRLNFVEHLPWPRLRDRCRADLKRALLRREVECFLFGHFSVVS